MHCQCKCIHKEDALPKAEAEPRFHGIGPSPRHLDYKRSIDGTIVRNFPFHYKFVVILVFSRPVGGHNQLARCRVIAHRSKSVWCQIVTIIIQKIS
jgi:hypothetical protein